MDRRSKYVYSDSTVICEIFLLQTFFFLDQAAMVNLGLTQGLFVSLTIWKRMTGGKYSNMVRNG